MWSSGEQRRRQQRQRRADPTAAQQTKHKKENPDVISVKFSDTRRREKSVLADPLRKHSRDAGMEGGRSGRGRLADPSSSLLFYYYYHYFCLLLPLHEEEGESGRTRQEPYLIQARAAAFGRCFSASASRRQTLSTTDHDGA